MDSNAQGSRWFMVLGLLAMLVAIGALGLKAIARRPGAAPASQSAPAVTPQQPPPPADPGQPVPEPSDPAARNG